VQVVPPGRPATTWRVATLAKSVELPHSPISTPSGGNHNTHTITWKLHLQALILSVVGRQSLVRGVARLRGLKGLLAYQEPSS
jgi:hypothetical protein